MNLHLVDAFTDHAFSGNPAAVMLLASEPTDEGWMQSVAMEMNQAETAFVWPLSNNSRADWGLRWFTPTVEVDLCGHATLASAHVLWQEGQASKHDVVSFYTPKAGHYLQCSENTAESSIRMTFPVVPLEPTEIPLALSRAVGVKPMHCSQTENGTSFLQLKSAEEVRTAAPNFTEMANVTENNVIISAMSDQIGLDVISRFFAPSKGIDEDSVTGSAHCALAPWWSRKLKQKTLACYQASPRGGHLLVEVDEDKVVLNGKAVTTMRGNWSVLPKS